MTRRLRIVTIDNTVGATSCPATALPSEAPESIPIFLRFLCSFCVSLFVFPSVFFLYCIYSDYSFDIVKLFLQEDIIFVVFSYVQ